MGRASNEEWREERSFFLLALYVSFVDLINGGIVIKIRHQKKLRTVPQMEKETRRSLRRRKILTTLNFIFEYGPRQPGSGGRIEESDIVLTALQMTDGMKEFLKGILDKLKS